MMTFLMFGKYTVEALRGISRKRTEQAVELIQQHGGDVDAIYATLGRYDLVLIVSFPDVAKAMEASLAVSKLTGIGFATSPAVTVEEFDAMATG